MDDGLSSGRQVRSRKSAAVTIRMIGTTTEFRRVGLGMATSPALYYAEKSEKVRDTVHLAYSRIGPGCLSGALASRNLEFAGERTLFTGVLQSAEKRSEARYGFLSSRDLDCA